MHTLPIQHPSINTYTPRQARAKSPNCLSRRRVLAHLPDLRTINKEQNRRWNHSNTQESQQARSPRHTKGMIHGRREKREACPGSRSQEGIGSNGRVGVPHVDINDIVQSLQENHQDAPTDGDSCDCLGHPGDVGRAGPGEPEETDGEDDAAENHGWETLFWNDLSMFLELASEASLGDDAGRESALDILIGERGNVRDSQSTKKNTNTNTKEWQSTNTLVPATLFLE